MFPSLLTSVLFSFSVIFASRSARVLGGPVANLARLMVALLALGLWAHLFGGGFGGPALPWLLMGGVLGFGLGDMALFGALTRIGPRLSILFTQCLAAPIAMAVERLWLGSTLSPREVACAACILVGVAIALAPDHGWEGSRRTFWIGAFFGIGSAGGQALGAVFTRKAYVVADQFHFAIDGGTAAYQRIVGGVLTAWLGFLIMRQTRPEFRTLPRRDEWVRGWPAVVGNALAGPALGVACFQWALRVWPSGKVLAVVAVSPIITMLLAWAFDSARPTRRALWGGALAVAGAVTLNLVHGSR